MDDQKDIDTRIESFMAEYKTLTEKYQVDFTAMPQYIQISPGSFATKVYCKPIDVSPKPEKTVDQLIKAD